MTLGRCPLSIFFSRGTPPRKPTNPESIIPTKVLVATDVCARGLDIPNVAMVVNYDMPNQVTAVDLRAWFHHTISGLTLHVSVFKRKIIKKMMMKTRIQAPRSFYK